MKTINDIPHKKSLFIDLGKLKKFYTGLGQISYSISKMLPLFQKDFNVSVIVPKEYMHAFGKDIIYIEDIWYNRLQLKFFKTFDIAYCPHQDFKIIFKPRAKHFVFTIHDLNFLIEKKPAKAKKYLKSLENKIRLAHQIIVISQHTKNELLKYYDAQQFNVLQNIKLIYNVVPSLLSQSSKKITLQRQEAFFFAMSAMFPKKNFEALIDMMAYLKDEVLYIAGEGNVLYYQSLQEKVKQLHLQDRVFFLGNVSIEEKIFLYQQCKAYLSASLAEGFGLTIIEAMQFNKPIFASAIGAHKEIGKDYVVFWDNFNPQEMANMVTNFFSHPMAYSNERINYALSYNQDIYYTKHLHLFKTLLS